MKRPVGTEIVNGGFSRAELDARGLVPLAKARKIVRRAKVFARGATRIVDGAAVTDADVLWAALLSLGDTAEFVREARRLEWKFVVRGLDNVWPLRRYGKGILPWLVERVDAKGGFRNRPNFVAPCLLAIDAPEAFDALLRIRNNVNAETWVRAWVDAHPDVGLGVLARRAGEGEDDERAKKLFRTLAKHRPSQAFAIATKAIGAARAQVLFDALKLPFELRAESVLAILDDLAEGNVETEYMPWPRFNTNVDGRFEYHGLRLLAARARRGNGWGILFERLTGCTDVAREVYRYGSDVPPGLDIDLRDFVEADVPEAVTAKDVREHDLRPGATTERHGDPESTLRFRAVLAKKPAAFWTDARKAARWLGLGNDPEIVVDTATFEHVVGTKGGASRSGHDTKWRKRPSASATYRSLAHALVERDPALFRPGTSNVDWRLHAIHKESK